MDYRAIDGRNRGYKFEVDLLSLKLDLGPDDSHFTSWSVILPSTQSALPAIMEDCHRHYRLDLQLDKAHRPLQH